MFHMLTCFNLGPDRSIEEFEVALTRFGDHMRERGLVDTVGRIGRRRRDTILDTDEQRHQKYFFILSFRNRKQCDRAIAVIDSRREPEKSFHRVAYAMITEAVFTCWEDI